jgi:hypothetical protein
LDAVIGSEDAGSAESGGGGEAEMAAGRHGVPGEFYHSIYFYILHAARI